MEYSSKGFQPVKTFRIYKRNLPHWEQSGNAYFITFRTAKGINRYDRAKDTVFYTIIFHNKKKYKLYAGVIMADHVHPLFQPLEKIKDGFYSTREIVHSIKSYSANRINKQLNKNGPVWLDENFDRIVMDEKELLEKMGYIVDNPIKPNLVDNPEDYRWIYVVDWGR